MLPIPKTAIFMMVSEILVLTNVQRYDSLDAEYIGVRRGGAA